MSKSITIPAIFMALQAFSPLAAPYAEDRVQSAQAYILDKLHTHDIVFLGTTHKQPAILACIADLLPLLHAAGVTHLGLEIGADQQKRIDHYLTSGKGLADISLPAAIDCLPYRQLFKVLCSLPESSRPRVIAIDLPPARYGNGISRDEWMARTIGDSLAAHPQAKALMVLGSLHVLRKLEWQGRLTDQHAAIRTYLEQQQPELRMFSIVNIVSAKEPRCDFGRLLGPGPESTAVDLDARFEGWTLGLTRCIAIKPAPARELVDGVIVY